MVQFEVYDENVRCVRRENLKFKDAKNTLLEIESIGVEEVIVFCPYTENRVAVRTGGSCNYYFRFTNNQMEKLSDLFVRLNGGKAPEHNWYY